MIKSFKSKEEENLFKRVRPRKLPQVTQRVALRKLLMLDAAVNINDLRLPPGNRLEKLMGDWAGQYSIRINQQWRICFVWSNGNAYEVEITDYH